MVRLSFTPALRFCASHLCVAPALRIYASRLRFASAFRLCTSPLRVASAHRLCAPHMRFAFALRLCASPLRFASANHWRQDEALTNGSGYTCLRFSAGKKGATTFPLLCRLLCLVTEKYLTNMPWVPEDRSQARRLLSPSRSPSVCHRKFVRIYLSEEISQRK